MKKNILAFGVVFAILMFSGFSRGETTVAFAFGDGYRMSAPETVTNGIPVHWSVCVTNTRTTASRIDVAAEVAAIGYDGSLLAELFRSATTNVLEVGEFRRLSFTDSLAFVFLSIPSHRLSGLPTPWRLATFVFLCGKNRAAKIIGYRGSRLAPPTRAPSIRGLFVSRRGR